MLERTIVIGQNEAKVADLRFSDIASQHQSVTLTASVSDTGLFLPDPAQRVMIRDETLNANPGRPGLPISIPGMPQAVDTFARRATLRKLISVPSYCIRRIAAVASCIASSL